MARKIKKIKIEHYDKKLNKNVISEYVPVNERVRLFHDLYPEGQIHTEIIYHQDGKVVIMAKAFPGKGLSRMFTGLACEDAAQGFINKTSYLENCETSAVGRALGFLNIGVDDQICSAEEMVIAKQWDVEPVYKQPRIEEYDGEKFAHASEVSGMCIVPQIPYLDEWAYVGTAYHEACDNYIRGGCVNAEFKLNREYVDPKNIKEHWTTYNLPAWIDRQKTKYEFKFDCSERKIRCKELNVCGKLDAGAMIKLIEKKEDGYAIIDFKRPASLSNDLIDQYFIQICYYAMGYHEAEGFMPDYLVIANLNPKTRKPIFVAKTTAYIDKAIQRRKEFKERFGV